MARATARPASPLQASDHRAPLLQQAIDRGAADRATTGDEIRALVDATFDVIATTGSVEPQVRDILDRAGLSRQVFYRHFTSKDELLLVVVDEMLRMTAAYLWKRTARADGPAAALRAYVDGVMKQAQNPEALRRTRPFVIMGSRLQARFPTEYEEGRSLMLAPLVEVIATGTRAGVFASRNPADDAAVLYDAVFARQNRHIAMGSAPTRKTVDELTAFALRALRPS